MFPWLAFGHILPYLELAKHIAEKGHQISFISTPRNIQRLPKLPSSLSPLINFVKFPLPRDENLPENAEATTDLPYDKVQFLKKAFDLLQEPMTQLLQSSTPDWIIYDFAPHWLPPIAAQLNISRAFFCIFNAWTMSFFGPSEMLLHGYRTRKEEGDLTAPPKWFPFGSKIAYRPYEVKRIFDNVSQNASGVSDGFRLGSAIYGSDVLLIRSCVELEADWLNLFGQINRKPIIPIGLLPPSVQDIEDNTWQEIRDWLEQREKGSVVYIALGSEVALTQDELTELALGLELSGLPFFWASRNRPDLPCGFIDRIKGRGLVWTSWAPQLRILAHQSVGGFLTHCGWSSIIEGLQLGRPLIMMPFLGDQGLNARVFEERGVGIEIPRDEQDGSFTRNSVAESLKKVMVEDEGKAYNEKAKELSKIFGDKERHQQYLDNFVKYFEQYMPT